MSNALKETGLEPEYLIRNKRSVAVSDIDTIKYLKELKELG